MLVGKPDGCFGCTVCCLDIDFVDVSLLMFIDFSIWALIFVILVLKVSFKLDISFIRFVSKVSDATDDFIS